MKRIIILILISVCTAAALLSCATLLEDERVTERPHVITPIYRPQDAQIEVSNFEELKDAMLELVKAHETNGRIVAFSYDGEDVQADVNRAIHEILTYHPIGVFAVSEIAGHVTKIVTLFEIDISIEYMRTREQLDSVVSISATWALREELLAVMSDYRDESVFRTNLRLTAEDIIGHIVEIYYQNPRSIVRRPVVAVEVFPEVGNDRIFSVSFEFGLAPGIPRTLEASLALAIQNNVQAAVGETEEEILLSLANNLIAIANFDEFAARTLAEHGIQNPVATAFGALVNGSAVGEGFAMAFKALCDELGIEAHVVLGTLNGRYHAWNIVFLDGFYYHIDVAMGDVYGIENHFLRNDTQMRAGRYIWDFANTPSANGPLTFQDVAGSDEAYYEEDENEAPVSSPGGGQLRPPSRPGDEPEGTNGDEGPEYPIDPEEPEDSEVPGDHDEQEDDD